MKNSDHAATTRTDRVTGPGAVTSIGDPAEPQTDLPSVPGDEAPLAPEGPNPKLEHHAIRIRPDNQRQNHHPAVITRSATAAPRCTPASKRASRATPAAVRLAGSPSRK
jgi:hypothetical protein